MRFIFVNLHTNFFMVKTIQNYLAKKSFSPKHRFILEYLLENDYKVACFINKKGNFLNSEIGIPTGPLSMGLSIYEYNHIMKKSDLDYEKIQVITSLSEIEKDDVVILYNLFHNQFLYADKMTCTKIVSMLHFFGTKRESEQLKNGSVDILFAEANLKDTSKIFRKNFSWYNGDFLVTPFVFQERFQLKKEFHDRKNKAIAMGTLTINKIPEFIDVYGNGVYQPLRKQILDNKDILKDIIDCYITLYAENDKLLNIKDNENKIIKKLKMIYNMFHTGQQKGYFSFDMVEKYNGYKLCIVPEDIQGMPGVGFVEGMACGCAYIGVEYEAYRDYGMIPGVHYISYDGTLADLRAKCEYYLNESNEEKLFEIAMNGYSFAREHFTNESVAKKFIDQVIKLKGGGKEK